MPRRAPGGGRGGGALQAGGLAGFVLSRGAFFIGNEGNGLTDKLTDKAQKKIKIPMCGKVESLNAAMASGLLVYEARRQRQGVD